jgi:hypothetical protein
MKVKVGDKEFFLDFYHDPHHPHLWGRGFTGCFISEQPKQEIPTYYGYAYCGSMDTFSKRKGRKVAFANAIKHLSPEERREWWKVYFKNLPQDLRA